VQETGVGKTVNGYRKHSSETVANCARKLVSKWKHLVHTTATDTTTDMTHGNSLETETCAQNGKQLVSSGGKKADEFLADQYDMKQRKSGLSHGGSLLDHPSPSLSNGVFDGLTDDNVENESFQSSPVTSAKSSRRSAVTSTIVDGKKEIRSDSTLLNNKDSSQSADKSSKNYLHSSTSQSSHSHSSSTNSHDSGKNSRSVTSSDHSSKHNTASKCHESSSQREKSHGHATSSRSKRDAENSSSKRVIADNLLDSGSDDSRKRLKHSDPSVSAPKLTAEKKDYAQVLPSDSRKCEKYDSKLVSEKTSSHDTIQRKGITTQSKDRSSSARGASVDSPSVKRARFEVRPDDSDAEADEDNTGLSFEEMLNYDAHAQSKKRKAQSVKNNHSALTCLSEQNYKGLSSSSNKDVVQQKKHDSTNRDIVQKKTIEMGIQSTLVPQPSNKV
jgi:hypothetical protein